ncbi:MAG: NAD(P)H-dependent glycerol-3-phosphate dehydrogenase [Alphaproteobacteria bacterium]|nr:NAD(P)H-dependent glycerol-3-phosphate dehydrogenase [Alphaproteobacteria bacterium]
MKISILGAGSWGTALAIHAARRHQTLLWARDAAQAQSMKDTRRNQRYLPGVTLPVDLDIISGPLAPTLTGTDLVVLAGPMSSLRPLLQEATRLLNAQVPVAWLCKGFEAPGSDPSLQPGGSLPHEVQSQVAPHLLCGALSGPSFAQEVAAGLPTALVAASPHDAVRQALVSAFHVDHLRVYENADIIGVEVGGAVKNVMAIATGLCDGMALGLNARAALITRGLAEITCLGLALGARGDTFMGLSGLGDLVLTATGDLSRNRRVGLALAQGLNLAQAVESLGHVAEGVYSARTVMRRAHKLGVDMPITAAVMQLLEGQITAQGAVSLLMSRQSRSED